MARKPGVRLQLLSFFTANVGKVLDNATIRKKFGESSDSWTRRVRELRAQGYPIQTDKDRDDLKPGQYILTTSRGARCSHTRFPKRCVRS